MSAKGKILVIEDERGIRVVVSRILELEGYDVFQADDGESGLEMLRGEDGPFDLLILDSMMSLMDGREVLEEVKKAPGLTHIPVIIMSASADSSYRKEAFRKGVVDYLVNPVSPKDLTRAVMNALKGPGGKKRK